MCSLNNYYIFGQVKVICKMQTNKYKYYSKLVLKTNVATFSPMDSVHVSIIIIVIVATCSTLLCTFNSYFTICCFNDFPSDPLSNVERVVFPCMLMIVLC